VQLQQSLALLHIAFAPGQILGVARVDQVHLKTTFFQNVVQGNSVDPGRLHRYRHYSTTLQPVRQPIQIGRETPELAYWFRISIRTHRHIVGSVTYVNPCGLGVNHIQPRVVGL
jgi:hypothetical protein